MQDTKHRFVVWTSKIAVLLSIVSIMIVSFASLRNSYLLSKENTTRNMEYLSDVMKQSSLLINEKMDRILSDLSSVGDSSIRVSEQKLSSFLSRKEKLLDFSFMYLIELDGIGTKGDGKTYDFSSYECFQKAKEGKMSASKVFNDSNIMYFVPYYDDGEIVGVIAASKTIEQMQDLMNMHLFQNQSRTYIIDGKGNPLIFPKEENETIELKFKRDQEGYIEKERKMLSDMEAGVDGYFDYLNENNEKMLLNYHRIDLDDWYMITIVPYTAVTNLDSSISISVFLSIIVSALFLIFLLLYLYTERMQKKRLERLAFQDSLTKGMNKTKFLLEMENCITKKGANSYALVALDLQNFKLLNDMFGNKLGDETIQYIYDVMKRNCKENELVARSHADLFYALMEYESHEILVQRVEKIIEELKNNGYAFKMNFNVGIYVIDEPQLSGYAIQDRANTARKSDHVQEICKFYTESMKDKILLEKELSDRMEFALKNQEFEVYLQPKVGIKDYRVTGAEALVRWNHAQRGFVSPVQFIPLFEKDGTIRELDLYVFEQVCKTLDRWQKEGKQMLTVSVNLSRYHLKFEHFMEPFLEIFKRYSIESKWLEFELTETMAVEERDVLKIAADEIHRYGFQCSLDDFGCGYSSLGLLKNINIDVMKLDSSFFKGEKDNAKAQNIVRHIVELIQSLHMKSVAEGIEKEEELMFLKEIGCDSVQGYIFSRPLPILEFEEKVYKDGIIQTVGIHGK